MREDSDSSVRMNHVYINQIENLFVNEADASKVDFVLCFNYMAMILVILLDISNRTNPIIDLCFYIIDEAAAIHPSN